MILDYFLTLVGAKLIKESYGKYIVTESYELNPLWQKAINKGRWFNLRQVILSMIITLGFYYLTEYSYISDWLVESLLGFIVMLNSMIIGRHFGNVMTFLYLKKNPGMMDGQIVMQKKVSVKTSQYQLFQVIMPVGAICLFNSSPFAWGGFSGLILFFIIHYIWGLKKT